MKDKVIIESMRGDEVGVYLYDEHTKEPMSIPMEMCDIDHASEKYDIIGSKTESGFRLYYNDDDEDEDDYTLEDFNLVEEDDD